MNVFVGVGRITKDIQLDYTPNTGIAVAKFTLAIDRAFKNANGEKEADFIPTVVWRNQAEHCAKYLSKGSLVAVEGRIQTRNYEDTSGKRVYVTELVADNVRFLEPKKNNDSNSDDETYNFGEEVNMDVPF